MSGLTGCLLGLCLGLGLTSVGWWAFAPELVLPRDAARLVPRGWPRDLLAAVLASAGLGAVSPGALVALAGATGFVAFLVVAVVSRTLPVALVFGAMGGGLPFAVVNGRAQRRQREFADVWPDAVDDLASAVRAGMSLPEALGALAVRGPEPLRPAFARFALDYQVSGRFGAALDRLAETLADPVGDRVVEGLRIAREVGVGQLGPLLRNLSAYLRDDARTRSELEARQAWAVSGARLAVAAPWLVLLMMSFQGEVIRRYQSPAGAMVLAGAAVLCVLAYRVMMRIGRLPRERRLFR